jgi:uncharacterized protein (DUF362 family)
MADRAEERTPEGGHGLTRRDLLRRGLRLGAGALAAGAWGCAGPVRTEENPAYVALPATLEKGEAHLLWTRAHDADAICEAILQRITDFSWLAPGDSVLLKVACNSGNPHPAVTYPAAVAAVARALRARGAGEILVADQAGVEHVRRTATTRWGTTRTLMEENGLRAAARAGGASIHCFDERGWEGYRHVEPDFVDRWEGELWLADAPFEVDHIVNLPRLGHHALAGITCGVKLAVGYLRDDSRRHLHQRAGSFFEQMAELAHVSPLREKHRFTLTIGEQALLNIGPDFGSVCDFDGLLALGSTRLVDHDLVATAVLAWLDSQDASFFDLYAPYPEDANFWNRGLVKDTWGEEAMARYEPLVPFSLGAGLAFDRCLSHLAALQRYRPAWVRLHAGGDALPPALLDALVGAGQGEIVIAEA